MTERHALNAAALRSAEARWLDERRDILAREFGSPAVLLLDGAESAVHGPVMALERILAQGRQCAEQRRLYTGAHTPDCSRHNLLISVIDCSSIVCICATNSPLDSAQSTGITWEQSMKAYVMTTGAVFGLLTLLHVWRALVERSIATDPWFILITVASAALCVWAVRLLQHWPRS